MTNEATNFPTTPALPGEHPRQLSQERFDTLKLTERLDIAFDAVSSEDWEALELSSGHYDPLTWTILEKDSALMERVYNLWWEMEEGGD